ncbi:phosphate ABC transporter permease PstA [Prochlorococcus sp. MIT 1341]|uniref:phosphate ABC transporter permease PstA n=1 Tax=Prochlorococcus sp. MIT 1341 TaxID=3096221 RepID=UPI002A74986E|nr:phosphate ABC transporter permease PstA [Prochlorococcus sp. MIT 1341]
MNIKTSTNQDPMSLTYKHGNLRNIINKSLTITSAISALLTISPLIIILIYIMVKGGTQISIGLFTQLPEPPGDDITSGGIGNAIIGTLIVTLIGASIAVPIGIGGGIYLAEYSQKSNFSKFIRFGTNILAGIPSIIAGICVYGSIVSSKIILGSNFSALAGGLSLSILMLPTIIKTTEEGLKLVPDGLRKGAYAVGACQFTTITRITLPAAITPIATGIVLAIARAAGETAPLIFTALFSFYWSSGPSTLLEPIASLSVLIYNFALEPYQAQNELAWAASFVLVLMLLTMNILARLLGRFTPK